MPNSHPSDFRRNLRREIAGYFLVAVCALPIRLALMARLHGSESGFGYYWEHYLGDLSLCFIAVVVASKLRLRYKLALTFLLVAV